MVIDALAQEFGGDFKKEHNALVAKVMIDGEKVKVLRKALNLSQAELAVKSATDQTMISKIENNRCNISSNLMISVALALNCTPNDICIYENPTPPPAGSEALQGEMKTD